MNLEPAAKTFEKFLGKTQPLLGAAIALFAIAVLLLLGVDLPSATPFIILPISLALFLADMQSKRKEPKRLIYWDNLDQFLELFGPGRSDMQKAVSEALECSNAALGLTYLRAKIVDESEFGLISDDCRANVIYEGDVVSLIASFVSPGRNLARWPSAVLISELPVGASASPLFEGRVMFVGKLTTTDGKTFDWFTNDLVAFYKKHQHLRSKGLKKVDLISD